MHIIWGIILIAIGLSFVMKTEGYLSFFGRMEFFEKWLGVYGGSRIGYKLIGIFVVFLGTVVLTNMTEGFMMWLLSPLMLK